MRTTKQIIDDHGVERGVCCGHGEYWDLPNRVTTKLISEVRREALLWAAEQIAEDGNPVVARERILSRAKSV